MKHVHTPLLILEFTYKDKSAVITNICDECQVPVAKEEDKYKSVLLHNIAIWEVFTEEELKEISELKEEEFNKCLELI